MSRSYYIAGKYFKFLFAMMTLWIPYCRRVAVLYRCVWRRINGNLKLPQLITDEIRKNN